MFKSKKSNLDEMQEQKLLRIESKGCWLAFWGLLIVIIVENLVSPQKPVLMLGEWIVFMCLALYIGIACIKNGVWDRRLKANAKTNFWCSLLAGGITAVVMGVTWYINFGDAMVALWIAILNLILVPVICFFTLTFCMKLYEKRVKKMEAELEE